MARYPGKPFKEPDFDPLLAVHRIQKIELTERSYEFPEDYDFEKFFNQNFGVIKEEAFEVVVEFTGYAAEYVAERIWSPGSEANKKERWYCKTEIQRFIRTRVNFLDSFFWGWG